MEQYLFNLTAPRQPAVEAEPTVVTPNIWLMSAEEIPPILFTTEEVARLLGIGKCRVYDLIRHRELRSVKVGASRRISARALNEYVGQLERELA
jgi:excisionase family DNA binding protein